MGLFRPTSEKMTDQMCGFAVAFGLGFLLAVWMLAAGPKRTPREGVSSSERINPNTASAASLARLPGIGLTRASAIVAYRTQAREQNHEDVVFASSADLQRVRGIGPQTAAQMGPWLDYGPSDPAAEPSPQRAPATPISQP